MASVVDLARKKKYKWKDEENQQNYQRKQQENLEKTGGAAQQAAKTAQRAAAKAQEKNTTGQGTTLPRAIGTQKTYQGYYEQKTNSREAAKASDTLNRLRSMREYRQNLSQRIYSPNDYDQKQIAANGVEAWQKDIQSQLAALDSRMMGMEKESKQAREEAKKQRENFLSAGYKTATGQTARQQSLLQDQQAREQSMEKVRTEIQNRINYPTKKDLEEIDRVGMDAWKAEMQKDLQYINQALEKNKQTQQEAGGGDYAAIQRAKRQELEDVLLAPDARQTIGQAGTKSSSTLGSILDGTFDMRRAARYLTDPEFASKAVQGTDGKVGEDLDFLTEDEKNTLLYYAGKGDWQAMQQYYSVIERDLQQWRQEETNRQTAESANKNKVGGVAANIAGSLLSPLALLETGGQAVKNAITGENEPVNTASPLMAGAQLQKATQEGITRDMGAAGQFLTNTGLSIGQNLVRLPLGPAAALGSMAASAGGQTALDTAERGGSAGQALSLALLSGAAEGLTEKLPLDNIFRLAKEGTGGGLKNAVKAVLRQAGTEAGEETVSEIANTLADNIIMADQSQMEETIRQMMNQQGMSEQEARKAATLQYFVQNPALAAAGGALSGGIFGAGAQAYNALSPTQRSYRKLQKAAEQLKKVEQEAQEYDKWKQEWAARDAETLAQREAAMEKLGLGKEGEKPLALPGRRFYASPEGEITTYLPEQEAPPTDWGVQTADEAAYQLLLAQKAVEQQMEKMRPGLNEKGQRNQAQSQLGIDLEELQRNLETAQWFESLSQEEKAILTGRNEPTYSPVNYRQELRAPEKIPERRPTPLPVRQAEPAGQRSAMESQEAAWQEEELVPFDFEAPTQAQVQQTAQNTQSQQAQQLNPLFSIDASGRQVVSPKGVQTIQELGQKLGKTVTWTEDENFNGSYDPQTGEIKISKYTKNPALFVFKHELTHSLEGTDAYRDLQKHIMQSPELMTFAKSLGGNVSMLARAKQKSYQAAGQEIDLDQAMREVVADYVGSNLFTDEKSIRSLAKAKPNVAQRILGWIQRTYKKVRGQWGTEEKWLYQAEQLYRRAIQQSKKAPAAGEAAEELSIGQEFFDEYKTLLEQYGPELRQEDNAPASEQPSPAMSKKGKKFMEGNEKKTAEKIAQAMDIPKQAKKDRLLPAIRKMTEEIGETGKISQETADAAFEEAYRSGLVVLDDFYKTYKGLRDELRTTRLQISPQDRADISDFEDFRKSNMGRLQIVSRDGIPVDTKYQELRQRYPELFPEDITHPGAQLEAIADVRNKIEKTALSLDQYYGPDADRFKAYARNEFDKALDFLKEGAGYVKRYEDDRLEARRPVKLEESTLEEVRAAYEQDKKLQRAADRATAKNLLTNFDKRQVNRLLAGDIMPDELPRGTNRQGVMEVYEAKKAQEDNMKVVRQYRAELKESRMQRGLDLIEGADRWQDKNVGFNYSRETAERNMRDIMSRGEAENMIAAYFRPVHKAQADSIHYQNSLRDQVRALNISTKPKYQIQYQDPNQGDMMVDAKVSESALVQLLGEKIISLDQVDQAGADGAKIQKAVDTMRTIYNRLFEDINNTLMRNGYTPMESRKDYFPHFTDQGGGTFVEKAMNFLGLGKVDELPTDIAGMTHTFRPGKKWFGNMLRRKGGATDYDAIKGFDRYLNGAADVIYQTDNIQNLRTLENAIRYKYSDKGTKEEIEALRESRDLGDDSKELMIQGLLERDNQHLPQMVTWLRNYTDILAGKKHPSDRSTEHEFGRRAYNFSKKLEGKIAANMVAISPGSWLTNFVPITQAMGQVSKVNLVRAMYDTVRSNAVSDGFAEASTFLTNRRGADPLYKSTIERATDIASRPMYWIDNFTAGTITRAKYYDNLQKGMSEEAALEQADEWAAGLMGDRSKGAVPTLFEKKNPIAKSLTMFQLEVNNQLSFLFKDIPREEREKGALILGAKLLEIFIGAKLFDDALEKIAGRRAALDPLEIINDLTGDITGKKMNNVFDILGGEGFLEETEAKNPSQVVANLWSNLADQTPFIGGLIGGEGGRLPVASALPDFGELSKLLDGDVSGKKKKQILKDELLWKTGMYLLPPAGGTQFKRWRDAYNLLTQQGNYKLNDKGEKQLRYLATDDTPTRLRSTLFGQYSTEEGQEYIDKGFPMLSVKKTKIVDDAESQGINRYLAKEIMDDASGFEKDWDFRRYLLERDDLTPEQKKWIDKRLFDYAKVWERIDYSGDEALMEMTGKNKATNERVKEAVDADIDAAIYQRAYEAQKGIKSDKDKYGETIPLSRDKKRKEAVEEAVGDELTPAELKKLYDILDISKKA